MHLDTDIYDAREKTGNSNGLNLCSFIYAKITKYSLFHFFPKVAIFNYILNRITYDH